MPSIKLTPAEARNAVWDDHDDFNLVPGTSETVDSTRWSIIQQAILEHKPTGKFYLFTYSVGATESQDEAPYQYDTEDIEVTEVSLQKVEKEEWLPVSEKE